MEKAAIYCHLSEEDHSKKHKTEDSGSSPHQTDDKMTKQLGHAAKTLRLSDKTARLFFVKSGRL